MPEGYSEAKVCKFFEKRSDAFAYTNLVCEEKEHQGNLNFTGTCFVWSNHEQTILGILRLHGYKFIATG